MPISESTPTPTPTPIPILAGVLNPEGGAEMVGVICVGVVELSGAIVVEVVGFRLSDVEDESKTLYPLTC